MEGQRDHKGSEATKGWKASVITKGQRPRRDGGTTRSQRVKGHGRMEDRRDHKGSEATEGRRDNEITKGQRPRKDGGPA